MQGCVGLLGLAGGPLVGTADIGGPRDLDLSDERQGEIRHIFKGNARQGRTHVFESRAKRGQDLGGLVVGLLAKLACPRDQPPIKSRLQFGPIGGGISHAHPGGSQHDLAAVFLGEEGPLGEIAHRFKGFCAQPLYDFGFADRSFAEAEGTKNVEGRGIEAGKAGIEGRGQLHPLSPPSDTPEGLKPGVCVCAELVPQSSNRHGHGLGSGSLPHPPHILLQFSTADRAAGIRIQVGKGIDFSAYQINSLPVDAECLTVFIEGEFCHGLAQHPLNRVAGAQPSIEWEMLHAIWQPWGGLASRAWARQACSGAAGFPRTGQNRGGSRTCRFRVRFAGRRRATPRVRERASSWRCR